jgi:VanZ family protein
MITRGNSFPRLLYFWLPPLLWMGLIFFASSQPGTSYPDLGILDFVAKKLAHVLLYAALYILLFRAFTTLPWAGRTTCRVYLPPMLVVILYAISDEVHQTFVPSREGAFRDVCIDAFGMLLAYLFVRWWTHRR